MIAGKDRGATGVVILALPKEDKVVVEGVHMVKKHKKQTARSSKGQIIEKTMPIHVSNVMLVDPKKGKGTRIKITREADGTRGRVAVKSGTTL